ncbi:MAG: hypothetical protein AAF591_03370 [Verrucomicrobiota bacterium]
MKQSTVLPILLALALPGCGRQEFQSFADVELPVFKNHAYKNDSVATQPGARIVTPSSNTIIVSVKPSQGRWSASKSIDQHMKSDFIGSMTRRELMKATCRVLQRNGLEGYACAVWAKPAPDSEIKTSLDHMIVANYGIRLPQWDVDIHAILSKGRPEDDLQTIERLTSLIIDRATSSPER